MICRICLQNSNKCFGFFDEEGIKLKAAEIIAKYFWFDPRLDDNISINICLICWSIIKDFHQLYIQAEEANLSWVPKLNSIKTDPSSGHISDCENYLITEIEKGNTKIEPEYSQSSEENLSVKDVDETNLNSTIIYSENENFNLTEEINERKIEISKVKIGPQKRRRGRPSGSTKKIIKKKEAAESSEEESSDEKLSHKNQKRTPEEIIAFNERLAEGDVMISNFTRIFCNVCSVELPNFTSLKTHTTFAHKQKGFIICCDKKFYKRSKFVDHIEKHVNPDKYKCHLCNKISISRWTLKNHMKNAHKATTIETYPYQCSICDKAFKLKNVMLRHQLIHVPEEDRKFKCNECNKSYPSQGTLNHHVRTYHDRRYSGMCDICGKTYNNKQDVKRHRLEVHEGAERMKYKCKLCDLVFSTKYLCNRHKFEKHIHQNQAIEHKCTFCNKTLANSEALKSHIQYAHKAKSKFECNLCGKHFKRDLVLKEHMAAHTGQPLYACPHCPKTFTHSSNMHHHRKRVHPIEFEEARKTKDDKRESWCKITALAN